MQTMITVSQDQEIKTGISGKFLINRNIRIALWVVIFGVVFWLAESALDLGLGETRHVPGESPTSKCA